MTYRDQLRDDSHGAVRSDIAPLMNFFCPESADVMFLSDNGAPVAPVVLEASFKPTIDLRRYSIEPSIFRRCAQRST